MHSVLSLVNSRVTNMVYMIKKTRNSCKFLHELQSVGSITSPVTKKLFKFCTNMIIITSKTMGIGAVNNEILIPKQIPSFGCQKF